MAAARVAVQVADAPQVKQTLEQARQVAVQLTEDRDALGGAAAAFLRANVAWNAVCHEPESNESAALSAYWHTYDHLVFALPRLGYLDPGEDAGGSGA